MTKLEKALQKLIDKEGFEETKSLLGLSTFELIQKSNCRIDLTMANEILGDLFKQKLFPRKYNNCKLSYDGFSGTVNWICDWDGEIYVKEQTESMATPFWDDMKGVPVNTEMYEAVDSDDNIIMNSDNVLPYDETFTFINWVEEFNNLASYSMWIRRFYLPQVYLAIQKHLNNYRNYKF